MHLVVELKMFDRLPDADVDVARAFISWVDHTPAARNRLRCLGVCWEGRRKK